MPIRIPHLFTSICYCMDCKEKMVFKKDRSIGKYVCSTFNSKNGNCNRNAIKEKELLSLISSHYCIYNKNIEITNNFFKSEIDKIVTNGKDLYIKFKNGLPDIISKNNIFTHYGNMCDKNDF